MCVGENKAEKQIQDQSTTIKCLQASCHDYNLKNKNLYDTLS